MTNEEKWFFYTKELESPDVFITFNLYYLISCCLGRKIWFGENEEYPIYPNLFVFFVGPPACGKSLPASKVHEILQSMIKITIENEKPIENRLVNMSPDSATLESLWQALALTTKNTKRTDNGKPYIHSSMAFCLGDEIGTLFRVNDKDLVMFLTRAWDCRDFYRKTKNSGEYFVKNMCINLLGTCTQDWIADNMSAKLVGQGFTSRTLFVYASKPRHRVPFIKTTDEQSKVKMELIRHLKVISEICGEIKMTAAAVEWYSNWVYTSLDTRVNKDKRLEDYYGRKRHHLIKLAIARHFFEKVTFQIDLEDIQGALRDLETIETTMHYALQGIGRNPIAKISNDIKKNLKQKKEMTRRQIIFDHFDGGNIQEIEEAIIFLLNSQQIIEVIGEGGVITGYKITEKGGAE